MDMHMMGDNEIEFELDGETFIGQISSTRPPYADVAPIVFPGSRVIYWMQIKHIDEVLEEDQRFRENDGQED